MKGKILVTGGAGYIGSHVVNLLGQNGHDIIVIDNLSTGKKESVLYGELIVADLNDKEKIEEIFSSYHFSACLHFAGSIVVPESCTDPISYYKNNTVNAHSLIDLCVKYNIEQFVFSSTAAVYGLPEGGVCSESSPTIPINPYGRSKLMTEWMLEDTAKAKNFRYVALRYFNVAGANVEGKLGQNGLKATHLIKIASECVVGKREKMSVFGTDYETADGTCIRDYIHIDDLARAHLDALRYLDKGGKSEILNCGYGHGSSVNEVLDIVKKVSGTDFQIDIAKRRDGDAPMLVSKAERIKDILGWKPSYDNLELIVKTAIDWEKKISQ